MTREAPVPRPGAIELAAGADENGLAVMLSGLIAQNLEAKPHKWSDFAALHGSAVIVADDVGVALTLRFDRGERLTIHDGIVGLPRSRFAGRPMQSLRCRTCRARLRSGSPSRILVIARP